MDQVAVDAVSEKPPPQPQPSHDDHHSGSILSKKKKSGRRRHSRRHSKTSASGKEHEQPTLDVASPGSIDAANAANISTSVQGTAEAGVFPTNVPGHTAQPITTGEGQPAQSQPTFLQPPSEQYAVPQPTTRQPSLQQQLQPASTLLQPGLPQEALLQLTLPQPLALETAGMLPQNTGGIQQMPGGQTLLTLPPSSSAAQNAIQGSFLYPQEQVLSVPVPAALYQQQPVPTTAFPQAQPTPGVDYSLVTPGPAAAIAPAAPLGVVTGVESVPSMSSLNAIIGPHVTTVPPVSQDNKHILGGNEYGASGASRAASNVSNLASKASKQGLAYLKSIFRSEDETDATKKSTPVSGREPEKSLTGEHGEEIVDEQDEDSIASPASRRARSKSRAKSRSRTPKSRKPESAAPEKDSADAATSVGALRLDKDIVNKLVAALAARRQLTTETVSPLPEQEQKDGAMVAGCIHKNALCKAGHLQKKAAEEFVDSEDFFEELVEEIVEPKEGMEEGPRKRIVRKTTKSRQHNVIEEPWGDKKRDNALVTAIGRMQAVKSRLSAARGGDRAALRYREDEDFETTEAASFENARRTPSTPDWLCACEDKEAMPARVKKGVPRVKMDQRYAGLPFPRPLAPPWHRVPLPESTCPYNVGMMRAPHQRPMPKDIGGCARQPSLPAHTGLNSGCCRCPCDHALCLHPSAPQQGCGCAQWPSCRHSIVCAACNGPNKSRQNSQCGNLTHVRPCYENFPGCAVASGHASQMNGNMGYAGQSCAPNVCPCCTQTTAHHSCHCDEARPVVAAPAQPCSCHRSNACGANPGVATVPNIVSMCDATATAAIPQTVHHGTTAKRECRPRRVVYRACPPPFSLPVIEHPTQARLCGCTVPACAARTGGQTFRSHCQEGGTSHVIKPGVTLEEVLRREDDIRWQARLQERRQLLDEERIREEERLAFAEYLKEQERPLDNEPQYLEKPEARRFLADLQREIARRKSSESRHPKTPEEISGKGRAAAATQSSRQPRLGVEQVQSDGPGTCVPSELVPGVFDKPELTGARSKPVSTPQPQNVPRRRSSGPSGASAAPRTPETNGGRAAPSAAAAARKPSISKP